MKGRLLLDTHAIIWMFSDGALSDAAASAIDEDWSLGRPLLVSPMSAWEIGMLVRKGRIRLPTTPLRWIRAVLETPGVALTDLSVEALVDAPFLPENALRDPVDQILVSTARTADLVLITRDEPILRYGAAGHVRVIAC